MAGRTVSSHARAYVRARALAQMTYTVRIVHPDVGALDRGTLQYVAKAKSEIYSGIARVYEVDGGGFVDLGDGGPMALRTTWASIPFDVSPIPQVDDILIITGGDDGSLETKSFRIMSVSAGGFRATRRMQLQGITDNRYRDF